MITLGSGPQSRIPSSVNGVGIVTVPQGTQVLVSPGDVKQEGVSILSFETSHLLDIGYQMHGKHVLDVSSQELFVSHAVVVDCPPRVTVTILPLDMVVIDMTGIIVDVAGKVGGLVMGPLGVGILVDVMFPSVDVVKLKFLFKGSAVTIIGIIIGISVLMIAPSDPVEVEVLILVIEPIVEFPIVLDATGCVDFSESLDWLVVKYVVEFPIVLDAANCVEFFESLSWLVLKNSLVPISWSKELGMAELLGGLGCLALDGGT